MEQSKTLRGKFVHRIRVHVRIVVITVVASLWRIKVIFFHVMFADNIFEPFIVSDMLNFCNNNPSCFLKDPITVPFRAKFSKTATYSIMLSKKYDLPVG